MPSEEYIRQQAGRFFMKTLPYYDDEKEKIKENSWKYGTLIMTMMIREAICIENTRLPRPKKETPKDTTSSQDSMYKE